MKLIRIHASYHKNLTVYFQRIMGKLYNDMLKASKGYAHFQSMSAQFYENLTNYKVLSINNHFINPDKIDGPYRITRFIRDPRDLIVSGYFYHKKGTEKWCNIMNPSEQDFQIVNGAVPNGMKKEETYTDFLNRISFEQGLFAEIDLRRYHFQSMREWPHSDELIKLFKYENIIGNEPKVIRLIFQFYQMPVHERMLGNYLAKRYSAKRMMKKSAHIRNPQTGQWRKYLTKPVLNYFNAHYKDILIKYGYPLQ